MLESDSVKSQTCAACVDNRLASHMEYDRVASHNACGLRTTSRRRGHGEMGGGRMKILWKASIHLHRSCCDVRLRHTCVDQLACRVRLHT
jgi:hypothetical protein